MAINESVYGARENWIVPSSRTELGHSYSGDAYYYNQIASDDNLKIKVANFDTSNRPVTSFCSQMDGQYPNESYLIRNNWTSTQTDPIDRSIVQFGIGPQSGLADIEWWGVKWVTGQSEPTGSEVPSLLNHDKYDIVNIGLGLEIDYVPPMNYTAGSASNLTTGDMLITNEQYINRQVWGDEKSYFRTDSSSSYNYHVASGYAFLNFITQIPIKNLKIYPRITAYKSDTQWKQFNSIQDYLAEKNDYPLLGCIEAMFRYRSGINNTTDYNSSVSITPIFTDKTTVLKGYQNGTDPDKVIRDENLWYSRSWRSHFVVAGRYGYDRSGTYGMMNDIYWVPTYDSRSYTYAIFDAVYQTPDFKFTLDANKCFTCDVANMSDDDITEGIRKQLASFGLFFVDDIADINLALDDEKTFLGILENGVGYGKYSHGADNRNQPQWNWDTMEENDYDPENPPTPVMPDNWSDTTNPPYSINKTPLPNKWYTCPPAAIPNIMNAVNSIDLENLDKSNTFGLNPIDGIIAIRKMFFNNVIAENFLSGDIVGAITIGVIQVHPEGGVANAIIRHTSNAPYTYIPVTGYPVGEKSELRDFRSYLPYTSCMFYDAFCGSIEVDPAKILNKYITITQTVDFLNGDKITSLYASEKPSNIGERIAMLSGKCFEDVPLNGNRTADYLRNKYILSQEYKQSQWNAISRSAMGAGGASISGISGNVTGAATQAVGTLSNTMMAGISSETIETQMTHLVPSVSKINAGTSNVEAGVVSGPTLFLYLPKMNENYDQLLYGNLTGFAGYKVVKPKDLNAGTHIFSHPKVSISGTKNEAYMLVDQLQKGIIIK